MARRLTVALINVIVFAVLAEALALVFFYYQNGGLFYTHPQRYALIEETASGALTADALHPYFGPTHKPGVRAETNNFGFGSPRPFPYAKTRDDQFIVGIFGGSVGREFCDAGAPRLIAHLRKNSFFTRREIIPLCFSHEGYKQPQQVILTSYFLSIGQQFDLVINIDGFNEVALGTFNQQRGHDFSMPSPIHLDPLIGLIDRSTMTAEQIQSLATINLHKERVNALAARIPRTRIAAVGFVLDRRYAMTSNAYRRELATFNELRSKPVDHSIIQVTAPVKPREGRMLYEDIAANWVTASLLMHDMLAARSVAYFHVLQPNQYFSKHRFSADEDRRARNHETPFKPPIEQGYPVLIAASHALAERAHFINAVAVFDDEPAAVYKDDCCHYTEHGYRLFADFIAARILATRGAWNP